MIFLTVGHQMAFDRLLRWADEWAQRHPDEDVLAQVGDARYAPQHLRTVSYLSPLEFDSALQRAPDGFPGHP